jgi:FkbH-like protein
MKKTLEYFKLAQDASKTSREVSVRLITNFTDTTLQKLLTGVCREADIEPTLLLTPYKQYHLFLKNQAAEHADITFIFFDVHNYAHSAFQADEAHFDEIIVDLECFCTAQMQPVIMTTFSPPFESAYGNLVTESPLYQSIEAANKKLHELSARTSNLYLCDIGRLLHSFGEHLARDFRGMYAFDIPFTNDFFLVLAKEWLGLINAHLGLTKKCLVVDLDNTLWGGILGEVGPLGIALGPDYPGLAYQNFQRALLEFYNRGIILAINSRNNEMDVLEVFKINPHMILKPEHFAAMRINWQNKAQNILELAQELNIGTDTMVFIDDDAMNRDLVRTELPEVVVPEWHLPPEEYVLALLSMKEFYQLQLTEEDRKKGTMYAQERARKVVHASIHNIDEYIKALGIHITMRLNDQDLIPRLSQMTMKTNQFNVTTKRYTEKEIADYMARGAWVVAADVSDKFGEYGTTILVIVVPEGPSAHLDTYLMSCRVLGRGIEQTFMDAVFRMLGEHGIEEVSAQFISTPKNAVSKDFLPSVGFTKQDKENYHLVLAQYLQKPVHNAAIVVS